MNSKNQFKEFLKASSETIADSSAQKTLWLTQIKEFYKQIKSFIGTLEGVQIEKRKISIIEEKIGQYHCDELILTIKNQQVIFKPIGTMIFGTPGRIDMVGPTGKKNKFVLVEKEAKKTQLTLIAKEKPNKKKLELVWKVATTSPIQLLELNEEIFFDLLLALLND